MRGIAVHHVSLVVTDLDAALDFYSRAFGLERLARPPFRARGIWLGCGDLQVHLVENAAGSFRPRPTVDNNDWHFAFRTDRFDEVLDHLLSLGFREDVPDDDPARILVLRQGLAGFPQLYIRDPDGNIIEVNGAPPEQPPAWRAAEAG
ncbi:MAG: VOC family protein [Rhizobiales bacterium]|nr:VOC family protein [Hyphomicrobiales bacterium]